jgi:hypothetical protein
MPWVIVEPGVRGPRSYREKRTMYLCDWPDCLNPAAQVVGGVVELAACVALCKEHLKKTGHGPEKAA